MEKDEWEAYVSRQEQIIKEGNDEEQQTFESSKNKIEQLCSAKLKFKEKQKKITGKKQDLRA